MIWSPEHPFLRGGGGSSSKPLVPTLFAVCPMQLWILAFSAALSIHYCYSLSRQIFASFSRVTASHLSFKLECLIYEFAEKNGSPSIYIPVSGDPLELISIINLMSYILMIIVPFLGSLPCLFGRVENREQTPCARKQPTTQCILRF